MNINFKKNKNERNEIYEQISSDPEIMHGKPCIKGTRIPVQLIVSMLADGMSEQEIIKEYPSLTINTVLILQ